MAGDRQRSRRQLPNSQKRTTRERVNWRLGVRVFSCVRLDFRRNAMFTMPPASRNIPTRNTPRARPAQNPIAVSCRISGPRSPARRGLSRLFTSGATPIAKTASAANTVRFLPLASTANRVSRSVPRASENRSRLTVNSGLELDWACVCIDANLRITDRQDDRAGTFRGTRWQAVNELDRRKYILNAHRVLLSPHPPNHATD